jgi:hypothetical protein
LNKKKQNKGVEIEMPKSNPEDGQQNIAEWTIEELKTETTLNKIFVIYD